MLAPLIGLAVDAVSGTGPSQLWPVGAMGLVVVAVALLLLRPAEADPATG